jgi:hypothetical protein
MYSTLLAALLSSSPFGPQWEVREFGMLIGGSCGASVWSGGRAYSGSPVVGVSFESGYERARLWLGLESYPTYFYDVDSTIFGAELAMFAMGPMFGADVVRGGPWITMGFTTMGVGGRFVLTPRWPERHRNHGVELRVAAMMENHYQITIGWRHSWWPRTAEKPDTREGYPEDEADDMF